MKARYSFVAMLLALLVAPAASAAPPSVTLGEILAAAGNPTVPAAWSGIWVTADTTHDCGSAVVTGTGTDVDTLCTGEDITEPGLGLDCTGSADDNNVNVTCTGSQEIEPGCDVTVGFSIVGTRSGDTYHVTLTDSWDFTPDGCAFTPDSCEETEVTGTRIAPEPSPCTSAVAPDSWGRTKASYR